jgi:hypothetical protein
MSFPLIYRLNYRFAQDHHFRAYPEEFFRRVQVVYFEQLGSPGNGDAAPD